MACVRRGAPSRPRAPQAFGSPGRTLTPSFGSQRFLSFGGGNGRGHVGLVGAQRQEHDDAVQEQGRKADEQRDLQSSRAAAQRDGYTRDGDRRQPLKEGG